jgi:pullulanase/glycogen debranching enzyme
MYLIANAHWEPGDFELPRLDQGRWRRFVDTGLLGDEAITEAVGQSPLDNQCSYHVGSRSVVVLIAG